MAGPSPPSAMAVANEDEAMRCVDLAAGFMKQLQFERAVKFCQKAMRLSPGTSAAVAAERLEASARREIASGRAPLVADTSGGSALPRNPAAASTSTSNRTPTSSASPSSNPTSTSASSSTPAAAPASTAPHAGEDQRARTRAPPPSSPPAAAAAGPPPSDPSLADRLALKVFAFLDRCGILPSYQLPIVIVYSIVLGLVLYHTLITGRLLGFATTRSASTASGYQNRAYAAERGPTFPGSAGHSHGHAGAGMPSAGLNLWGFLPGDIVYSAPGVYLCAPFATCAVVAQVFKYANAWVQRRARW